MKPDKRQETRDERQETKDNRQETRDKRQETRDKRQEEREKRHESEEFRLYSALNEVSKNAFERCAKDISNVRVFAEKIADTETKIHSCIVPTIEALEEQVELFEATVRNAEKKCDEIDARIAQLHV